MGVELVALLAADLVAQGLGLVLEQVDDQLTTIAELVGCLLAAREVAGQLPPIEHLNLGPDLLGTALTRLADAGAKHLES